ncbi:hypothetical protein GCM10007190_00660 [Macrococcus hajekii]|uniref:hypothetical protein n=1 Tax=Macrococcus hajekii TaxID=198482 RepID=UPI00166917CD|nr:hypothetical protein [Macrococcus hajekii]GGA96467.1 hypothetical protein GCM10007190_00660 [Macrococcus hajekii]
MQINDVTSKQIFYGYANRKNFENMMSTLGTGNDLYGTFVLFQDGEGMDNGEETMGTIISMHIKSVD